MVRRVRNRRHKGRPCGQLWMKGAILFALRAYKRCVSPLLPPTCRFEPTCSEYMYQAIEKKGVLQGTYLGVRRLLRCHPFCAGGFDPVP